MSFQASLKIAAFLVWGSKNNQASAQVLAHSSKAKYLAVTAHLLTITTAFCPPKPKLKHMAWLICADLT